MENLVMSTPQLTDQQKIDIVNIYKTGLYSYNEVGRIFNIQGQRVISILKKRNIPLLHKKNRKYKIDDTYFDEINTEEKAYFLGLIYADGCNYTPRNSVSIGLQEDDMHILLRFNQELKSNKPLYFKDNKSKNPNWQNTYTCDIYSERISKRLIELGIPQAKSLILKYPTEEQVPKSLIRPFLLGSMDGDGSFSIYDSGHITPRIKIGFVSTLDFCLGFSETLRSELNVNCSLGKRYKDRDTTTRQLSISGNNQVIKVLDWLYNDAKIFLNRKYEKYISIKQELAKFAELRKIRRVNGKN